MRQSLATKVTYWLKVVSFGMILGLGLQFAQAWVAPTAAPPAGNVAGPITTGSSQTKAGSLTTGGLAAPAFVDTDNVARYVNPSGTSVLWGLNIASLPNCDLKTNASGAVYCGTDATGGGGGISGSGISNYLPHWDSATNLTNSVIYQNGTNVVVGGTDSFGYKLGVYGTIGVTGNITTGGTVTANRFCIGASCITSWPASGGDSGSWCGSAYIPIQDNMPSNAWPCKGQNVLSGCPTGYTYRSVSTGSGEVATCVKN